MSWFLALELGLAAIYWTRGPVNFRFRDIYMLTNIMHAHTT